MKAKCCFSALSAVRSPNNRNITVSTLTAVNVSPHLTFSVLNFSSHGNLHQWKIEVVWVPAVCSPLWFLYALVSVTPQGVLHLQLLSHVASPGIPELSGLQQVAAAVFDIRLFRFTWVFFFPSLLKISQIYMKPWLRCGIYNNWQQLSSNVPLLWRPCGHCFSVTPRHKSQSKWKKHPIDTILLKSFKCNSVNIWSAYMHYKHFAGILCGCCSS